MMSLRVVVTLITVVCVYEAATKPVRRTLNFNMFMLHPQQEKPERFVLTTNGVSRFGPILEYLVQRLQGMMSVRLPPDQSQIYDAQHVFDKKEEKTDKPQVPIMDTAENEVDGAQEGRMPGVVVRPSRTKPGTYEVEIDVLIDDGQPADDNKQHTTLTQ